MGWLTALTYVVILGLVHCGLITFCGSLVVWSSKRLFGRMTGRPFIPFLNPLEGLACAFLGWGGITQVWFVLGLGQFPMLLAGLALLIDVRQDGDPELNYNARTLNYSEITVLLILMLGNVVRWLVSDHQIRWV